MLNKTAKEVFQTLIYYLLHINNCNLSLTHFSLFITFIQLVNLRKTIPMTEHIRPEFTSGTLPTYVGYHLQIFGAGRAKISLQTETNKKKEFYTALPKKDRAGFKRQKTRSLTALPEHFARIEQLLSEHPDAKVFRIHEKGNNNGTADNAHLVASLEEDALWLVMSGVVHRWALTAFLIDVLLRGKGKRTGEASLFNEYMASYEHDWEDAAFEIADYKVGFRDGGGQSVATPQPSPPLRPTPKIESKVPAQPRPECADDWVLEDPDEDPVTFTDPPDDIPDEPFPDLVEEEAWDTKTFKDGTAYGKTGLWAAYKDSGNQPEPPRPS